MSEHSHRTALDLDLTIYGRSSLGAPLHWIPPRGNCEILIIAGIHGEEADTTISLSRALRSIGQDDIAPNIGLVLCANPDGLALGTRGNAKGVDLNRNFPTANWQSDPTTCRWHADEEIHLPILTGELAGSESETKDLITIIEQSQPEVLLALHGPLACIDDPGPTPLGNWLAQKTSLPLVGDIGYPTPGSLGTWGDENDIPVVTWEFPSEGVESLSRSQVPLLCDIIKGNFLS